MLNPAVVFYLRWEEPQMDTNSCGPDRGRSACASLTVWRPPTLRFHQDPHSAFTGVFSSLFVSACILTAKAGLLDADDAFHVGMRRAEVFVFSLLVELHAELLAVSEHFGDELVGPLIALHVVDAGKLALRVGEDVLVGPFDRRARGHLDDFPWKIFVHEGASSCPMKLSLREFGVSGEAADIEVRCLTCDKAKRMAEGAPW